MNWVTRHRGTPLVGEKFPFSDMTVSIPRLMYISGYNNSYNHCAHNVMANHNTRSTLLYMRNGDLFQYTGDIIITSRSINIVSRRSSQRFIDGIKTRKKWNLLSTEPVVRVHYFLLMRRPHHWGLLMYILCSATN